MTDNAGHDNERDHFPSEIVLIENFFSDGRPLFQDDLYCGHDDVGPDKD
jgi:hypothetical protein